MLHRKPVIVTYLPKIISFKAGVCGKVPKSISTTHLIFHSMYTLVVLMTAQTVLFLYCSLIVPALDQMARDWVSRVLVPSIGISLDTYQNLPHNDPAYDHISIQANGNIVHGSDLAGPIPASSISDNIEDCSWHVLRIKWDPVTYTLSTYFDGVFRLSTQTDLVATIFNNDPLVYWGFSGATGRSF